RSIFAKLIVLKVKNVVKKTTTNVDDHLFDALIPPFKLLPIVIVFLAVTLYFEIDSTLGLYFQKHQSKQ
ncbi:MAG: mechanosensitive ion channel family protein, partial [Proteobacteria bacterium]|nr:mechanosensitive ion channel family protein [Pseudomonadota bacterium]